MAAACTGANAASCCRLWCTRSSGLRCRYDPISCSWLACVKQPTEWGRSVFLSTCPASDFGAFTEPQLMLSADQQDWDNARERVDRLRQDPAMYKPPLVDEEECVCTPQSSCWMSCP